MTAPVDAEPTPLDVERQVFVTLSLAFGIVGVLAATGLAVSSVRGMAGGALASNFTLLAPAEPASLVWRLIYLGLFAFTLWQWLPLARESPRVRSVGWLIGVTMILNPIWLIVTQRDLLWLSLTCVVAILILLVIVSVRLHRIPASGPVEFAMLDVTVGVHLGWICVAVPANVAATLVHEGLVLAYPVREAITLVVLVGLVAIALLAMRRTLARFSLGLAVAWGLAWVAWGRLAETPHSTLVGIAAAVGAGVVLVGALREERRAERHPRVGPNRAGD